MQSSSTSRIRFVAAAGAVVLVGIAAFLLLRSNSGSGASPVAATTNDAAEPPASAPREFDSSASSATIEEVEADTGPIEIPASVAELSNHGFRRVEWHTTRADDHRPVRCSIEGLDAAGRQAAVVSFTSRFRPSVLSEAMSGGIAFVPPDAVTLRFRAIGQWDLEPADLAVPADGARLDVVLRVGTGMVAGRVVDDAGIPLPGMAVRLDSQVRRTTDATGSFRFAPLADGSYSIDVRVDALAPGSTSAEHVVVKDGQQDHAITLTVAHGATLSGRVVAAEGGAFGRDVVTVAALGAAEERAIEVKLMAGSAVLRGRLVDADGHPVPFATLVAARAGAESVVTVHAGSDGEFELTQLAPGRWSVDLEPAYRETFNWTRTTAAPIELESGSVKQVELTVRHGLFLRGSVDSATRRRGLVIRITGDDGTHAEKSLGREGGFALGALAAGGYLLEVLDPAAENRPLVQERVMVDDRGEKVRVSVP